MKNIETSGGRW